MKTLIMGIAVPAITLACGSPQSNDSDQSVKNTAPEGEMNVPSKQVFYQSQDNKKYKITVSVTESEAATFALADDEVLENEADGQKNKRAKPEKTADDAGDDEAETEDGEDDTPALCAGAGDQLIRVTGNAAIQDVSASNYLAAKITGNKNTINVSFAAEEVPAEEESPAANEETMALQDEPTEATDEEEAPPVTLSGNCLVLGGNEATANVTLSGIALPEFALKARGNKAKVNLSVDSGSSVAAISADLNGNDPTLTISGDGDYTCPEASEKGTINCGTAVESTEENTAEENTAEDNKTAE